MNSSANDVFRQKRKNFLNRQHTSRRGEAEDKPYCRLPFLMKPFFRYIASAADSPEDGS